MRLPDNKRLQRRFKADSQVSGIAAFLTSSGLDMKQHVIMRSFPRKVIYQCIRLRSGAISQRLLSVQHD